MNSTKATFSEKEEKMLKSYNEEFYTSLKSLKFLSKQLPQNEKLFYHFEQNENASVSTTTGQLLSTYDELSRQLADDIILLSKNTQIR